jgi:hypothetical protein
MKLSILKVLGGISIVAGIVWTILFPKTSDLLRPDFVASLAIGLGLIIPGIILFFLTRSRILPTCLLILLVWSLLLNLFLFSYTHQTVDFIQKFSITNSANQTQGDPNK